MHYRLASGRFAGGIWHSPVEEFMSHVHDGNGAGSANHLTTAEKTAMICSVLLAIAAIGGRLDFTSGLDNMCLARALSLHDEFDARALDVRVRGKLSLSPGDLVEVLSCPSVAESESVCILLLTQPVCDVVYYLVLGNPEHVCHAAVFMLSHYHGATLPRSVVQQLLAGLPPTLVDFAAADALYNEALVPYAKAWEEEDEALQASLALVQVLRMDKGAGGSLPVSGVSPRFTAPAVSPPTLPATSASIVAPPSAVPLFSATGASLAAINPLDSDSSSGSGFARPPLPAASPLLPPRQAQRAAAAGSGPTRWRHVPPPLPASPQGISPEELLTRSVAADAREAFATAAAAASEAAARRAAKAAARPANIALEEAAASKRAALALERSAAAAAANKSAQRQAARLATRAVQAADSEAQAVLAAAATAAVSARARAALQSAGVQGGVPSNRDYAADDGAAGSAAGGRCAVS